MNYQNADAKFLNDMPKQFTRQDLLKATLGAGYSISKANQITEKALIIGQIERIKPGLFRKM